MDFIKFLARPEVRDHNRHFKQVLAERTKPGRHGDLNTWLSILESLPIATPTKTRLDQDLVSVGVAENLSELQQAQLEAGLRALSPWRKGPFKIFNTIIDTEWRSDWKWQRLEPHIQNLDGKKVLDVGCGSGYHCWRMLGAGAEWVLGIDPSMRFLVQNMAIQRFARDQRFDFLPLGIEDMPNDMPVFDQVFSMGVLYHRRRPINHLLELKGLMAANGELVLETLIVEPDCDGLVDGVLQPKGRYAQMRNVWSLMTSEKIIALLHEAGFSDVRCVNESVTTIDEQRSTPWMTFHSLEHFLDSSNHSLTIEGYPAPKRGIFIGRKRPEV